MFAPSCGHYKGARVGTDRAVIATKDPFGSYLYHWIPCEVTIQGVSQTLFLVYVLDFNRTHIRTIRISAQLLGTIDTSPFQLGRLP